jgi:hypothetical protein
MPDARNASAPGWIIMLQDLRNLKASKWYSTWIFFIEKLYPAIQKNLQMLRLLSLFFSIRLMYIKEYGFSSWRDS